MVAVQHNGLALKYADESLKKDVMVAFAAVKENRSAIQYVHDSIKDQIVLDG